MFLCKGELLNKNEIIWVMNAMSMFCYTDRKLYRSDEIETKFQKDDGCDNELEIFFHLSAEIQRKLLQTNFLICF